MTDVLVIGGGTAGLTAAIYARRSGRSVTLLEKENTGGQIVFSPKVENYPGLPGISGADFAAALTSQAEGLGVSVEYAEVSSLARDGDGFTAITDGGEVRGKALVLAMGTDHRRLGLDGEDGLVGCGVSYCAVCDGAFYADRDTAVVGGGSTALTDALFLSGVCRSVTVIHRREQFRGEEALLSRLREKPNVRFLLSCTVSRLLEKDGSLCGVTVLDRNTQKERDLSVDGLFVAIGQVPKTDICRGLVPLDGAGYVIAGEDCATAMAGVFAAGDLRTKQVRQLATAAADGAVAGLAASRYAEGR